MALDVLLIESGDTLLLEDGGGLLLESAVADARPVGGTFRRARWSWTRTFHRANWQRTFTRPRPSWRRVWRWQLDAELPAETLTLAEQEDVDFLFDLSQCPEIRAGLTISSGAILEANDLTFGTPATLAAATDGIPAGEGMSVRIYGAADDTEYSFSLLVTFSNGRKRVIRAKLAGVAAY